VDLLFVVDDSGSMGNEQDALSVNFNAFINDFVQKDINFKMAITTTDVSGANAGVAVPGSIENLTYDAYLADSAQFFDDWSDMIHVGTTGSGYEKGLEGSRAFF